MLDPEALVGDQAPAHGVADLLPVAVDPLPSFRGLRREIRGKLGARERRGPGTLPEGRHHSGPSEENYCPQYGSHEWEGRPRCASHANPS